MSSDGDGSADGDNDGDIDGEGEGDDEDDGSEGFADALQDEETVSPALYDVICVTFFITCNASHWYRYCYCRDVTIAHWLQVK